MFLKGEYRTMDDLDEILKAGAIKSSGDNKSAVELTAADLQGTIDIATITRELKGEENNE